MHRDSDTYIGGWEQNGVGLPPLANMKIACVLITHLPMKAELVRRAELRGRPVIITEGHLSKQMVLDSSREAARVAQGMPLSEVLSLCKDATLLQADEPYYRAMFDQVVSRLAQRSPLVEQADLGRGYVGLDGLEAMYGGESRLISSLLQAVPPHLNPRVGVASGKFPAYVAALVSSGGQATRVPDDVAGFMKKFPIDLLRCDACHSERSEESGEAGGPKRHRESTPQLQILRRSTPLRGVGPWGRTPILPLERHRRVRQGQRKYVGQNDSENHLEQELVEALAGERVPVAGDEALLLGFLHVGGLGEAAAIAIVQERERGGPYKDLGDAMRRTGLHREAVENLVTAGAFDSLASDRRRALWEVGLRYRPGGGQQPLELPVEQDMAELPGMSEWEAMAGEYRTLGLYPDGHLMAHMRPHLGAGVVPSNEVPGLDDGEKVTVAGLVIRRQRPLAKAVFITLEDEFGHTPLIVWPAVYDRYRQVLREPVLRVKGVVSRRDGTLNIVVTHAESLTAFANTPKSKNWG